MTFIRRQEKPRSTRCSHPEHNPPTMIVLPAGVHTWKCDMCGEEQTFEVQGIIM